MRRAALRSLRLLRSEASEATAVAASEGLRASPAGHPSLHQAPRAQLSALTGPLGQRYSSAAIPLSKPAGAHELSDEDYGLGLGGHTETHRKHHHPPTPAETGGPLGKYEAGLASGQYRPDPRQRLTIQMLQELYDDLQRAGAHHELANQPNRHKPRRRPSGLTIVDHVGEDAKPAAASTSGNSWFSSLFNTGSGNGVNGTNGRGGVIGRDAPGGGKSAADAPPAVRGLYMYGGVGCGKTMLMDLFVHTAPAHFRVLRTHFHDFMLEVHAALRKHSRESDPLLAVADGIAGRCRVLALDELFVTDVADAMILNRLFGRLWERGVVLVATSNRQPDDLYKGGLQRNLFMPFIHRLKTQCRAHDMASGTDYRRLAQHQRGLYFVQPTPAAAVASGATAVIPCAETAAVVTAEEELAARFKELTGDAPTGPARVEVAMGRHLDVPLAAGKACMFSFGELCGRPVAAADYLALTSAYHTLALRGVPVFGASNRSEAYRFVTLIDVLYEARTRLLVTAAAPPVDLFKNIITQFDAAKDPELASRPDVVVDDNLGFAKDRTISRLTEMQSLQYLLHHARQHEPALVLALEEAFSKKVKAAKFAGA